MFKIIQLLFFKEITETRRDKRSLATVIILSMVMPLSMVAGIYFTSIMRDKAAAIEYQVVGSEHDPALVSFLNEQGFKTSAEENGDGIQLIIPDDYRQKLATGYLPTLTIRADFSSSPEAVQKLGRSLEEYSRELALGRLVARGVSPLILQPFTVAMEDTGDVSVVARFLAPGLIFMFLITPIYALMPAGIDCTAGERERHGLFPLLLQPIPAISIPIAKFLMLVATGMFSFLIAASTGFIAYSNITLEGMNFGFDFSFVNLLLFLLVSMPTVMMLSALIMGFASFAKTFKEGQTYVGMAAFLPVVFIGAGFVLDEGWRGYVPFWSETLILSSLLSGDATSWAPWVLVVAVYLLLAAACLWWISRSIRKHALSGA